MSENDSSKTFRFSIRLEHKCIQEIDALKESIENRSGFEINRTQMVRRLIDEGLKSLKKGKITF